MPKNLTNCQDLTPHQEAEHKRLLQSLTPEQYKEWQRQQIEQIDREIAQSWQRSSDAIESLSADPDPLREKSERELQRDILAAVRDSRFSKVSLAQIARYNSIPLDVVTAIAQQIAAEYMGQDLERQEFEDMSKQIQQIESQEQDPGIRDWKLGRLAKRHGSNRRAMMECYNKSLCSASTVKAKPIGQFLDEHLQNEVKYLIHGWLPQGITLMIHGDGGAGKTLLVYELMAAVLDGQTWNGYHCSKAHTLLVQVDEPEVITAERIDLRGVARSAPLQILSDWQVEQMATLESEAAKMPRNSLIIIDSITAINRNCYFSENDTEYARPILQIRDIARKFGHTVILIHHSNAEGNARGTRAISASVDAVWALSLADATDRLLRVQKTRMGLPPGRYRFAFDDETFQFAYRGQEMDSDEDFDQAQTQAERIRLWLNDDDHQDRRFEPIEIAEQMGGSKATTRRCLLELWMKGLIDRIRKAGSPYYLYFVKKKQESDRAIGKAIGKAIGDEDIQDKGLMPSDRAIGKIEEKRTTKTIDFPDRPIASTPLSHHTDDAQPKSSSDRTSDRGTFQSDRTAPPTDRPIASGYNPLHENPEGEGTVLPNGDAVEGRSERAHLPSKDERSLEKGDTVLVTGSAVWCRSGSDKLPSKEVPPSQRSTAHIPINVLGEPLFHELMEGGKVIEVMGDRVKVRSQRTGRTSVFAIEHCRVLRKGT